MTQEIALLAFANDQLPELVAERKGIQAALQTARERGSIAVECEPNAGVADIFTLFGRYAGRVAVFHYGGHANGHSLQLQSTSGAIEVAHAEGLAAFLGRQPGLKLVFLNACATAGQVDQLLAAGVKAVIATAAPVEDAMARVFALRFYTALGAGATLGNAFDDAAQEVATRWGKAAPVITKSHRALGTINPLDRPLADPSDMWGLYAGADAADIFDWTLPKDDARAFTFRAAPVSDGDRARVNTALAKAVFAAAEPYSARPRWRLPSVGDGSCPSAKSVPPLSMPFPHRWGSSFASCLATKPSDRTASISWSSPMKRSPGCWRSRWSPRSGTCCVINRAYQSIPGIGRSFRPSRS
jgi:hypothetical protein